MEITNSFKEWQRAYKELLSYPTGHHEVTVYMKTEKAPESDVLNLCHLFPLAHALYIQNKISSEHQLKVNILTSSEPASDPQTSAFYRISVFFALMCSTNYIDIKVNSQKPLNVAQDTGRLFPLCEAAPSIEESNAPYCCPYHLLRCSFSELKNTSEGFALLLPAQSLLRYIENPDQYIGERTSPLSAATKDELCQRITDEVKKWEAEISILSFVIWLMLLRDLIQSKQLFLLSKKEKPLIHESMLEKSRMDAISYGEAMYQLIENACLHSDGQRAWFGFRMHRINDSGKTNQVLSRYSECIPAPEKESLRNESCFFEFYVIDNAYLQKGMVDHYNNSILQKIKEPTYNQYCSLPDVPSPPCELQDIGMSIVQSPLWKQAEEIVFNQSPLYRRYVSQIHELFALEPRTSDKSTYVEDLSVHYGLRLLRSIVTVNKGYLQGFSPAGPNTTQFYYNNANSAKEVVSHECFVTMWSAILPLRYTWQSNHTACNSGSSVKVFPEQVVPVRRYQAYLSANLLFPCMGINESGSTTTYKLTDIQKPQDKLYDIEKCREKLRLYLQEEKKDYLSNALLILQAGHTLYELEILVKSLFAQITDLLFGQEYPQLRIAIIFPSISLVHEFIRLFSILYYNDKLVIMRSVQIALCVQSDHPIESLHISCILAGECLSTTNDIVQAYVYHYPEHTLHCLPILSYIIPTAPKEDDTSLPLVLFPFDLILTKELPIRSGEYETSPIWMNSIFLDRTKQLLRNDIQARSYGCCIRNVHVRLGSKLHLDRFYEAELLFHDIGNTIRFAHIIAHDLLYGEQPLAQNQSVLLLGYEKYSAPLMIQIEKLLNNEGRFHFVCTAIIHDSDDQKKEVRFHPLFKPNDYSFEIDTQVVSIMPVGTTLSTIYKLHNTAKREYPILNHSGSFAHNYCIVLIGNQTDDNEYKISPTTNRYWESFEAINQFVQVMPEYYGGSSAKVRYLLKVNAYWYAPEDCPLCKNGNNPLPIVDVKHSETLPAAIFPLRASHQSKFSNLVQSPKVNRQRIAALLNNVTYSHICSGTDHFQFYIDCQKLYDENRESIDAFFSTVKVDSNAFHILISPLQISNSSIANTVISQVFNGCSRFLYFNIADAYRDEVRSKFSYITEDFDKLHRFDPCAKIHIHYVDNSIVSGSLINRARILMKMLLTQFGLDTSNVILFDHIFLTINRSSYDTINSYVSTPKDNLHAYIQLDIPSYNTENDFCPACNLVEKYNLLRKRSSSEMLDTEFSRLVKKHKKRTIQEYKNTIESDIIHSPSYFGWIRQWLYVNVIDNNILSFACSLQGCDDEHDLAIAHELSKAIDIYLSSLSLTKQSNTTGCAYCNRQEILRTLSSISLNDILTSPAYTIGNENSILSKEEVIQLVRKHLIAPRDYMRLYSMETAYEELEQICEESDEDLDRTYQNVILRIIDESMLGIYTNVPWLSSLSKGQRTRVIFVHNAEWLITYIKVLSRAFLSSYYPYRHAIVNIMSTLVTLMASPKKQFEKRRKDLLTTNGLWKKILQVIEYCLGYSSNDDSVFPLICYQLNITLIHRICDLQMNWIVTPSNISHYVTMYIDCTNRFFGKENKDVKISDIKTNLPPEKSAILRYLKALKTATMSSNDDIPCLRLTEIPESLRQMSSRENPEQSGMLTRLASFIQVENTRMLYTGMSDLEKRISHDIKANLSSKRPAEDFIGVLTKLNDSVRTCLRLCYNNINIDYRESYLLYQNLLSNFCRFWHRSSSQSPYEALPQGFGNSASHHNIIQVTYMLQYFLRIRSLSSIEHIPGKVSSIPYAYEELCRAICGLSGFDMCYIVFKGEGTFPEIIAQSGYYAPYVEDQKIFSAMEIDRFLLHFKRNGEETYFSRADTTRFSQQDTIKEKFFLPCVFCYQEKTTQILILQLAIHDSNHNDNHFYIVLHREDDMQINEQAEINETAVLSIARNILFMRCTLLETLTNDYGLLTNFRYDCSYIRPICSDSANFCTKLLHLSDLHVREDNIDDLISKAQAFLANHFKENNVDLLIISGDIADGQDGNASVMEDRYRCVERLLNVIVLSLWKDTMSYLSHDWRRRIVITTGNHDYASMNQYNAALDMRTLISGTPVKAETGTMSKFSYYIHFLIRYLDPPIAELLYHDLNEVRNYRNLNLRLLCLNCSSLTTPYRTNKMGVNADIVSRLTQQTLWTEETSSSRNSNLPSNHNSLFRVCVAHYSPKYPLSYFQDSYKTLPGWEWGDDTSSPISRLDELFRKIICEEYALRISGNSSDDQLISDERNLGKLYAAMKNAITALQDGTKPTALDDEAFYRHLSRRYHSYAELLSEKEYPLLKHIKLFLRWVENGRHMEDEYITHFLMDAAEHIIMGKHDMKAYENLIMRIHKEHPLDLILAGHIHAYAEEKMETDKESIPILVCDKLINPPHNSELNGYVITLFPEKTSCTSGAKKTICFNRLHK